MSEPFESPLLAGSGGQPAQRSEDRHLDPGPRHAGPRLGDLRVADHKKPAAPGDPPCGARVGGANLECGWMIGDSLLRRRTTDEGLSTGFTPAGRALRNVDVAALCRGGPDGSVSGGACT